jgi:hypothetical protein
MRFMSELERGKYANEFEDVHPDILNRYFGVHGTPAYRQHSGAGESDSDDTDSDSLDEQILADQESHIHHELIDIPKHVTSFPIQFRRG